MSEDVEFIQGAHIYLVNGIIVPSVTHIIRTVMGTDYSAVPPAVLQAAADYGNAMHSWIENYLLNGVEEPQTAVMKIYTDMFKDVARNEKIEAIACEKHIQYSGLYCGTYDIYGTVNDIPALIDIKTTAKFDREYLEWQLGMYKLAINKPVNKCYAIWIPKHDHPELLEIRPKSKSEIYDFLNKYEQINTTESEDRLPF